MRPVWKSPTTGVSASIMYLANFSSRASDFGPGCVKTRTLFFKVEFWPRLGENSSQEIFRHHRDGTTKEKDSQEVSRRSVFTQPGPEADIDRLWEQLPIWSIRSDINRGCVMIIGPVNVSQRQCERTMMDARRAARQSR